MKAVMTGMIATYPVGGVAWDYGQYALGLERLGYEVYYLEDAGCPTYDPSRGNYSDDCSYGVGFLRRSLAALSPTLGRRWHFRAADGRTYGLDPAAFAGVIAEADLFLNVSGGCQLRDGYMPCRRKVLLDTDPGWNHFVQYPRWGATRVRDGCHTFFDHDHFFTYAQRMGRPGCNLPDFGLNWHTTRPPVVLDLWDQLPPGETWTTVMTWNNFGKPIPGPGGVTYGSKEIEFGRVEDLPSRVPVGLEVAVAFGGSHPPCERWRELGWSVVDSHLVSETLEIYRDYVARSRGEFSVAKNVYVATGSGWFSCRSTCYLAASRPVVVQETGFSDFIPTGEGLLSFTDPDGAARAIAAVECDYAAHQEAAREVARRHFDSSVVLGEILDRID
jgi:hypothetical protein